MTPPFAKFGSAVDPPSRLFFFFFFLSRAGSCTPTHFYYVWVLLSLCCSCNTSCQKVGGESWLQEPRRCSRGAAARASVYLFVVLIRVRMVADGWLGLFFHACIHSLIYLIKSQQHSIHFSPRPDKKMLL